VPRQLSGDVVTGAELVAGRFVIAGLVPAMTIRRAQRAD